MNPTLPQLLPCGDSALTVQCGNTIAPSINRQVQFLFEQLKVRSPAGLIAMIPSYRSLFIQYDPDLLGFEDLRQLVTSLWDTSETDFRSAGRLIEIPVCYGGELGPDLDEVASFHNLTREEVITTHSGVLYQVYMIGFTPGFPFLGGLDRRLITPRKENPRSLVPAGTVGIADRQTGIYPIDSPGGWQLIGRTPIRLFDLRRPKPFYLTPGDQIKFIPISREAFDHHSANH